MRGRKEKGDLVVSGSVLMSLAVRRISHEATEKKGPRW